MRTLPALLGNRKAQTPNSSPAQPVYPCGNRMGRLGTNGRGPAKVGGATLGLGILALAAMAGTSAADERDAGIDEPSARSIQARDGGRAPVAVGGHVVPADLEDVEHMCALLTACDKLPLPSGLVPHDFVGCTRALHAELASCTWQTAGTVQSGGACANNADCENGYCDPAPGPGVCHYVTGPSCATTSDCGTNGVCVSNTCLWTGNPMSIKPALALGLQGKDRMKVRVVLQSNANRSQAPTIHDWRMDYLCAAQE